VVDYSNLRVAKTRDLSKYSQEVKDAANTLANNLNNKHQSFVKLSTLKKRLDSLAVLIKEFGSNNTEIVSTFKAI